MRKIAMVMALSAAFSTTQSGAGSTWDIRVGAGLFGDSVYPGSEDVYLAPVPTVDVTYTQGGLTCGFSLMDGLGADYVNPEMRLIAGINVNAGERRNRDKYSLVGVDVEHDDRTRSLLADSANVSTRVKTTATLGYLSPIGVFCASVAYHPTEVNPAGNGAVSATEHGFLYSLTYLTELRLHNRLSLAGMLGIEFMDQSYADAWYRIDGDTEAVDGFSAEAGLRDVQVALEVKYDVSERVGMSFIGAGTIFLGDARECPYTTEEVQKTMSLEIFYRF